MAGRKGRKDQREWVQSFATDLRSQGVKHTYEDPVGKQTVNVEPMLADRAEKSDAGIETQVGAVLKQFEQSLKLSVRGMLDTSQQKLEAEGRRYGFPDNDSIFKPRPVTAGQSALMTSLPGGEEVRGITAGAQQLVEGKQALKQARAQAAAGGPLLDFYTRPTILEPAAKTYHDLRQKVCEKYPLLASFERDQQRLTELGAGAPQLAGGATGQPASTAMMSSSYPCGAEQIEGGNAGPVCPVVISPGSVVSRPRPRPPRR